MNPTVVDRELLELAYEALTCPAAEAVPRLARLGFAEPERALEILDRLAGQPPWVTPLPALVLVELAGTGRPDRGLRHLERYVAATGTRAALFARLEEDPRLAQGLARLVSHSAFLTDILVRNPEYLFWLFEGTDLLDRSLDKKDLRLSLQNEVKGRGGLAERLEALRRAQRRELLRLAAAEVLGRKGVAQIGRELADLADVVLEIVLEGVMAELVARHGRPYGSRGQVAQFCIVCLGKLGGQELNFSSDIDLMFAYDEEGETRPREGKAPISNAEFFTRLGKEVIKALTTTTCEGFLYRVDMRLRPEGSSGLLVRSLESYWLYYETRGELWERQMLIKGRCAAGSRRVWAQFARMLTPFVYPAHFSDRPQVEIRRIKERIEARLQERPAGENNLKLQAGGIRDIEFIVQCLQLLNGRINPQVRTPNTLEAIVQLWRAGALSKDEARDLRQAYLFYRHLENLLQIADGRQVYALPAEAEARCGLARLLGLADEPALLAELEDHRARVRRVFEGIFSEESAPTESWGWLLAADPGSPGAAAALQRLGFGDGAAAHRHLQRLLGMGVMMSRSRQHLEALLPELLASLAAAPDPEGGLVRLVRIVEAYGAPETFFELLHRRPGFRRLLVAICGSSRLLAGLIQRDPGLLDGLGMPAGKEGRQFTGQLDELRRYHRQEFLRLGADDLLGLATAEETFWRLTELAEQILGQVYRLAWRSLVRRRGRPRDRRGREARFACLAAGKFGGREMDFGSDLDLFFVYAGEGKTGRDQTDNRVFFIELAQELIRLLQDEGLYRVDARLRPEGASAPMAISLSAYRKYLQSRAATWERLALSRARPVAGDERLGRQVMRAIHAFVFGREVDQALVAEMAEIRRRMEPRQEPGRPIRLDLKRSPGGLVDIEFIAQLLVLRHGWKERSLRLTSTRQALVRLLELGRLAEGEGSFLLDAYERLRTVEKGIRLATEQAEAVLPQGRELEILARSVGLTQGEELEQEVEALRREIRRIFDRIFAVGTS